MILLIDLTIQLESSNRSTWLLKLMLIKQGVYDKLVNLQIVDGIVPLNRFVLKLKSPNDRSDPKLDGNVPISRLSSRENKFKSTRSPRNKN